jgi:hypothetical protein
LVNLSLKTLLGGVSLVRGDHLDEAETARLLGVRITHNVALLDLAILLEQTCHLLLGETRVDAGHEEVGAWVAGTRIVRVLVLATTTTTSSSSSSRLGWRATVDMVSEGSASTRWERKLTGCHGHWERRCGRGRPPCRDGRHEETCCGHGRSHGARLRVVLTNAATALFNGEGDKPS